MSTRDIVLLKLQNGEQIMATVVQPVVPPELSPLLERSILVEDVASVQLSSSPTGPNELRFSLVPWLAGETHFALGSLLSFSEPSEQSEEAYKDRFKRIATPTIDEVAAASRVGFAHL